MSEVESGYAAVNGLNIYYETRGAGEPLVLLHGGVGASDWFEHILPALASRRRVTTVDLQGHGRTRDIDRPFRIEVMADDVGLLIQYLGLERADIAGYSLGASVALCAAYQYSSLVRKLILISTPYKRAGVYAENLASFEHIGPETGDMMRGSPLAQRYPDVDWRALFTKLGELLRQDYDWSKQITALTAPLLLVFADADSVPLTHIAEYYALLGGGIREPGMDAAGRAAAQLAILPGTTHYDILSSPLLVDLIHNFLDAEPPVSGA